MYNPLELLVFEVCLKLLEIWGFALSSSVRIEKQGAITTTEVSASGKQFSVKVIF